MFWFRVHDYLTTHTFTTNMAAYPAIFNLHLYLRFFIIQIVSLYICHIDAKYAEGILTTKDNWAFLVRFCFLSKIGTLEYTVHYPTSYGYQKILFYYDEPHQWRSAYRVNKTCAQKEALLEHRNGQLVRLDPNHQRPNSSCVNVSLPNGESAFKCIGLWTFNTARERWWYLALSNCNAHKGLYLKYEITMLNAEKTDHWFAQFSADEFYILHVDLIFVVLNILLFALSLFTAHQLRIRGLFHTTFKLYLLSVSCQCVGVVLLFVAYNEYAKDGQGLPPIKTLGQLCQAVGSLLFVLLILLLGKGYTVTRARLRKKSTVRLTIFITLYSLSYAILFIFELEVLDPGEVLYLYESPGGYGLLALRVIGWLMLLYAVGFSLKHHPHKLAFYVPFVIIFSLWFLTLPVLIPIFTYVIDKWVRETVVNVVELSVTLLGHLFFLSLTIPTSINKNFPFHIKTTQIRALEQFGTIDGTCHLDNFSRHPYEAPPIKRTKRVKEIIVSHASVVDTQHTIPSVANGNRRNSITLSLPVLQKNTPIENSLPTPASEKIIVS